MEKAVDVLLRGPPSEEERAREEGIAEIRESFGHMFPDQTKPRIIEPTPRVNDVIDLTGDDDDIPAETSRFRATTRSPDPSWQMVRSNEPVKSADDELNEVIQASYNDFAADESDAIPEEEITLRMGGRCVLLSVKLSPLSLAAVQLHCARTLQDRHTQLWYASFAACEPSHATATGHSRAFPRPTSPPALLETTPAPHRRPTTAPTTR